MLDIFVFIFGLAAGSFANVCIYRLPREKSVIRPRSYCPSCGETIPWHNNIPVLSFIFLMGRCRKCRAPISPRYPLVEILTAVIFLLSFRSTGISLSLPFYWCFFVLLIIASFTDFSHMIIPDVISIPGIFIGLTASFIFPDMMGAASRPEGITRSLTGVLTGGCAIWSIGIFGKVIFRKEAMGGGDVKLMAMAGSFLGAKLALFTILLGSLFGALVGGILIFLRLKSRKDYIPFGPYLALGAMLSFFWGERILGWYLRLITGF